MTHTNIPKPKEKFNTQSYVQMSKIQQLQYLLKHRYLSQQEFYIECLKIAVNKR